MKTHSPLPKLEYFTGVIEIVGEIIKKNISKSSTKHNTKKHSNHKRIKKWFGKEFSAQEYPIASEKSKTIHESVETQLEMESKNLK
jgi:hypothetical protein